MKNVLITGANRGVGKALVEKFASKKCNIIACIRTGNEEFEKYACELADANDVEIKIFCFDLEDEEQIKSSMRNIIKEYKKIDILINNAGYSNVSLLHMISMAELKKEMQINFFAPVLISQIISRAMMKNGGGCIVNIGSVSGIRNDEGGLAYGSSKAAIIFASKTMSMELAKYGIRVNTVSPGFIDTDMWRDRSQELYNRILDETPVGRQGTAEDVANAVYYLTSDEASYITGQNLVINGGRMI